MKSNEKSALLLCAFVALVLAAFFASVSCGGEGSVSSSTSSGSGGHGGSGGAPYVPRGPVAFAPECADAPVFSAPVVVSKPWVSYGVRIDGPYHVRSLAYVLGEGNPGTPGDPHCRVTDHEVGVFVFANGDTSMLVGRASVQVPAKTWAGGIAIVDMSTPIAFDIAEGESAMIYIAGERGSGGEVLCMFGCQPSADDGLDGLAHDAQSDAPPPAWDAWKPNDKIRFSWVVTEESAP